MKIYNQKIVRKNNLGLFKFGFSSKYDGLVFVLQYNIKIIKCV